MATQNAINNYGIPSGKRIIQDTGPIDYNPIAAQPLTTSYADIDGSDYSFTPEEGGSVFSYQFHFHHAPTGSNDLYSWFRLLVDGTEETESEMVLAHETTNVYAQAFEPYVYTITARNLLSHPSGLPFPSTRGWRGSGGGRG